MRRDLKYSKEDTTVAYFMAHLLHSLLNYMILKSGVHLWDILGEKKKNPSISLAFKFVFKLNYGLPCWLTW